MGFIMGYHFRKLDSSESKIYREIRLEGLKKYPQFFGANYEQQLSLEKLYFEKIIEENSDRGVMVGGFYKDQLIATCGVTFETNLLPESGAIIQMYVKDEHQRRGVAKSLLDKVVEILKERNEISTLLLEVTNDNIAAKRLYERSGFVENNSIEHDVDTIYMSQTLDKLIVSKKSLFSKVDCIRLYVPDLDEGLKFYHKSLGLSIIWRTETAIGLGMDGDISEIVIHNERDGVEVDFMVDNVDDAVESIRSSGGKIINGPFDIKIGRCAVVEDPFGNQYVILDSSKGTFITDDDGNVIE